MCLSMNVSYSNTDGNCESNINPLSPHDALKRHFTSLKTYLIFLQLSFLKQNFHETGLPIRGNCI